MLSYIVLALVLFVTSFTVSFIFQRSRCSEFDGNNWLEKATIIHLIAIFPANSPFLPGIFSRKTIGWDPIFFVLPYIAQQMDRLASTLLLCLVHENRQSQTAVNTSTQTAWHAGGRRRRRGVRKTSCIRENTCLDLIWGLQRCAFYFFLCDSLLPIGI